MHTEKGLPSNYENNSQKELSSDLMALKFLALPNQAFFDEITRLIQQLFDADIVLVSFLDKEHQWIKSGVGTDISKIDINVSFCLGTISTSGIFEISDTSLGSCYSQNPLVSKSTHTLYYAGTPLNIHGAAIGTLSIMKKVPNSLTEKQKVSLLHFAEVIQQGILSLTEGIQLADRNATHNLNIDAAIVATWQWDIKSGNAVFNKEFASLFGYDLTEFKPAHIRTFKKQIHQDDLKEAETLLAVHLDGQKEFFDFTCRMKHKDGSWVWIHHKGKLIKEDDKGHPLIMIASCRDVTPQKALEQQVKIYKEKLQNLLENLPVIVYRQDFLGLTVDSILDGDILELTGYSPLSFVHNKITLESIIHPDDSAPRDHEILEAIHQKRKWKVTYRILNPEKGAVWVLECGYAEYTADGNTINRNGFILNMTTETSLKKQLVKLTERLPGLVYQFQRWPDGRVTFPFATNMIKQICGITPEQAREDASVVFKRVHKDDLDDLNKSIKDSEEKLTVWQHQYRVLNDKNEVMWLSGSATPERLPNGSTIWHGYIENITDLKRQYKAQEQINAQLKLVQRRLDVACESAQIGFWQASLETGEVWWSPVIYKIFGFETSVIPNVALFKSTIHPEDRELMDNTEREALLTGQINVVHRIIRPDGSIRWVHELAKLVGSNLNDTPILVGSVQDITEQRKLSEMKDAFISTVSHELRTPLTAINGALSLVASGKIGEVHGVVKDLIMTAEGNAKRLSQLINDLLDLEKLSAGKMPLKIEKVNLREEINIAEKSIHAYAKQYDVKIVIKNDNTECFVKADALRLQQIFANLLSNAIKFSPKGETIEIGFTKNSEFIKTYISDNGPGIPPEFQDKIFERFSQADTGSNRKTGGTGLGLAICKELIEQMGGNIDFESTVNNGTTFFFNLPIM